MTADPQFTSLTSVKGSCGGAESTVLHRRSKKLKTLIKVDCSCNTFVHGYGENINEGHGVDCEIESH